MPREACYLAPGKPIKIISYYSSGLQNGKVKEIKFSDGTSTAFSYEGDGLKPGAYKVSVREKSVRGNVSQEQSSEYFTHATNSGELKVYKSILITGGEKTETSYNDCCGQVISIKKGDQETQFDYDAHGAPLRRSTAKEIVEVSYHKLCYQPITVDYLSVVSKKKTRWVKFEYDSKCNLISGTDSNGKGYNLTYNSENHLSRALMNPGKRIIEIQYANEVPSRIKDSIQPGAIISGKFLYSTLGEISLAIDSLMNESKISP